MSDFVKQGDIQTHYNISYSRVLKYSVELFHTGLNEHKIISAPYREMIENKVNLQVQKWNEKWASIQNKQYVYHTKESKLATALSLTKKAEDAIKGIENLLKHTISINDTIDWETIKDRSRFKEKNPAEKFPAILDQIAKPYKHALKEFPLKPDINSPIFQIGLSFLDKIFTSRREKIESQIQSNYEEALKMWKEMCDQVKKENQEIEIKNKQEIEQHERTVNRYTEENEKAVKEWRQSGVEFLRKQEEYNSKIDRLKEAYEQSDESAILEYCQMVLNNSKYPETFSINFDLEYNSNNNILIVEYELPSIDRLPKIKDVRYISSRDETKESFLSETQLNKMFDDTMYQIALRTIHELFEADQINVIKAISFNGWVRATNKATGKEETNCILSIQVNKEEFTQIDLYKVDPKICFKNLKGVASSKLSTLTPVQPILQINKSDKRFIDGYNVVDSLDNTTNIAAMNWEDFEHLIRELFEKEFKSNGGEVKVTQASRDGGVDAIAFDPDPIRGGKIVIQAKRYTNTVGVSAVRDLFGTIMNEGATKGILVSTADYGSDAYDFAKGKPITLLNGSNLLHLLEKHGHHAKIDLKEAKKILNEK